MKQIFFTDTPSTLFQEVLEDFETLGVYLANTQNMYFYLIPSFHTNDAVIITRAHNKI